MIFVTVGTQLAFDRLVQSVDRWAEQHQEVEFFAQAGPTERPPRSMPWAPFVSPSRADELMRQCELVVAHAGMGSILTALQYRKPILVMPRRAGLAEHRNDHQLATARWMTGRPGVAVVDDERALPAALDSRRDLVAGAHVSPVANGPLVDRLRAYIFDPPR